MATERIVHILTSKSLRIVVHCSSCPISPDTLGAGNKKTACLNLRQAGNREERRKSKKNGLTKIVKEQQCEWYQKDSLKKNENGLNIITCNG